MYTFYVKMVQIRSVCGEICQICTEKWGSRRSCLGTFSVRGLFQDSVLCKSCKQGYLWMLGLKLACHGKRNPGTTEKHTHFRPQITPSCFFSTCMSGGCILFGVDTPEGPPTPKIPLPVPPPDNIGHHSAPPASICILIKT